VDQELTAAGWADCAAHNDSREATITRLACSKAAAEFAASRPDAKSADVLKIAEAWEGWVNRLTTRALGH